MKTIIDSKQAERLKEVCEKYGVKLPDFWYHSQSSDIGEHCTDLKNNFGYISLTELLEWLPDVISAKHYQRGLYTWTNDTAGYKAPENSLCVSNKTVVEFECGHLVDALFELFCWTIENGYYKGV